MTIFATDSTPKCSTSESDIEKSKDVWEKAISAIGGRERILNIKNILITENNTHSVTLDVFPDKRWVWSNDAAPIGIIVSSDNYATGTAYQIKSDKDPFSFKLNSSEMTWHLAPMLDFLLETKWVKPEILGHATTIIKGREFDVVCTQITADAVRDHQFIFDPTTHLLARTISPVKNDKGGFTLFTDYTDYVDVQGIRLARRAVGKFENGHKWINWHSTFQIDVQYRKDLFDRPPRIADGSNGWKENR